MNNKKLIPGMEVGYLKIIENLGLIKNNTTFKCKCICGKTRNVTYSYLNKRPSISCGCMNFSSNNHGNRKYSPTEASFRAKATAYKSEAKFRKIKFSLSIDETVKLLKGNCEYCDKKPANYMNSRKNGISSKKNNYSALHYEEYNILYNGIDRVNNLIGYTKENTVSCCMQCNTAKLTSTVEEFKEWIINVYYKLIKK